MQRSTKTNELRRNEYLTLVESIYEIQKKKFKLEKEQRKFYDRIGIIYNKCILEISLEKNEKGKPVYSNEQLRSAALKLKLNENEEFCELHKKRQSISDEIQEICIENNKLMDQKFLLMMELGIPLQVENEKYPDLTEIH